MTDDIADRTVYGRHDQTLEDLDVLGMVLAALRRDLTGNPWYDNMKEPGRSALTAAAVKSLDEILPGFGTYVRALAVEDAINAIGQLRGYPQPIGSTVEGALTELAVGLEDERDRLLATGFD
jgi:hypothetical protein